jgi:hypothetical protein
MPWGAVVCLLGISALLELRARSYFLVQKGRPQSDLGLFWQSVSERLSRLKARFR